MAESGVDLSGSTGVRRVAPVRVGHAGVNFAEIPAAEAKLKSGAVIPGQRALSAQAVQFGNSPDVLTPQPAHAVAPLVIKRGGRHESGTHDANDVGNVIDGAGT